VIEPQVSVQEKGASPVVRPYSNIEPFKVGEDEKNLLSFNPPIVE
jgi:hypothetical protein